MPLPINYDFSERMTVRCVGAGGSDRTGKEGEYFGCIWINDQCWAIVLWDGNLVPELYQAEMLLIEKKTWAPLQT